MIVMNTVCTYGTDLYKKIDVKEESGKQINQESWKLLQWNLRIMHDLLFYIIEWPIILRQVIQKDQR